jgi:hypothetical protein
MNHLEISQIVFGLVLEGKKSPQSVLADDFSEPYSQAIDYMQKNPGWTNEDIIRIVSISFMQDAIHAAKSLNGLGESTDWGSLLKNISENNKLADTLEKYARKLKKGDEIDILHLSGAIQSRVLKQSSGLTRGSEISNEYKPFIKCGYKPLDLILNGIPADGPIVVYGVTGIGKSHFATNLISRFLHQHPDKKGAVYTLEMSAEHWKWRATKMYRHLSDVMDRLYISGSVRDVEELVAEISAHAMDIVVIDDLDGLARENSAAEFERIYKKVKEICRFLKIPVIVLAQPNRMAKLSGKFPGRYDIAWSGAAEDSAALLIALHRGDELDISSEGGEPLFPVFSEPHEYLIIWKSRDGWPGDYEEGGQFGPGAIILKPSNQGLWEGDIVGDRVLWRPGAAKRVGKKK